MEFPQSKDVTVTQIGEQAYFVTISNDGIGAVLGTCSVSGVTFGVSNITLETVKEIYYSDTAQEISHLNFNEEEIRFIKTGVTEKGFQKLFDNLIN